MGDQLVTLCTERDSSRVVKRCPASVITELKDRPLGSYDSFERLTDSRRLKRQPGVGLQAFFASEIRKIIIMNSHPLYL